MLLLAMDCDGTCESPNHPENVVKIAWLRKLKGAGHIVVFVSDSGDCQPYWPEFDHVSSPQGDPRLEALKATRQKYPQCELAIYISDNGGDDERSRQAGYVYVHPSNFRMGA